MVEKAAEKAPTPAISLAEALQRKQQRANFETIPSGIEGISLRHESDTIPKITRQIAGRLAVSATEYVERKRLIDGLVGQQAQPEIELKDAAYNYRGLRGFDSELSNFRLAITPKLSITWDREALRQLLGDNYSAVVHERIQTRIAVPLGLETDEGPISSELLEEALRRGLATLGLGKEATAGMISSSVEAEVDEPELADMLTDGRLAELPENAANINETWSISVSPLRKT